MLSEKKVGGVGEVEWRKRGVRQPAIGKYRDEGVGLAVYLTGACEMANEIGCLMDGECNPIAGLLFAFDNLLSRTLVPLDLRVVYDSDDDESQDCMSRFVELARVLRCVEEAGFEFGGGIAEHLEAIIEVWQVLTPWTEKMRLLAA